MDHRISGGRRDSEPGCSPEGGQDSDLSALYRQLIPWFRLLLRRRHGREVAEELAQEGFARAVPLFKARGVRHPKALLSTIASNLYRDAQRQAGTRGGPAAALDELPEALAPWVAPDQESAVLLKQVVLGLPLIYRDTFILNRVVGLTYAEIAQRQDITVKAVEYRMSRALALCQEALRD